MVLGNSQNDQVNKYITTQIQTASKEQLLLITYDIGIKKCRLAERSLLNKDLEQANENILKAQNVVRELMITLNMEAGGDVASSLMALYDYIYRQLVEANVQKSPDLVAQARGMLEELRTTWEEAIEKLAEERSKAVGVTENEMSSGVTGGGFNVAG
ncbi:flagellar export chaperone FliS [Aminobacterium sp. MB27-C1]|nr:MULTISPECIES: flagellar export chaperone FliS [unclassified Aminobacterium]MEA4878140.1 flagellar export chaperone FliS [Aminobacterium sp.]WMI70521.1 flagellar export chaperone FliS [Aminobacterium sp. MB27-C1]